MVVRNLGWAAVALIAATSAASAATSWHGKHRARIVIHPRVVGTYPGWASGSNAYPAHRVPLAAYPAPGGIGITFAPFGWTGWRTHD
jgi:hypothetical protein